MFNLVYLVVKKLAFELSFPCGEPNAYFLKNFLQLNQLKHAPQECIIGLIISLMDFFFIWIIHSISIFATDSSKLNYADNAQLTFLQIQLKLLTP